MLPQCLSDFHDWRVVQTSLQAVGSNQKHIKTIATDYGPEFAAHNLITKCLGVVSFTLPALMPHGRKERLKTQTSSLGGISQSKQTSMNSQTKRQR